MPQTFRISKNSTNQATKLSKFDMQKSYIYKKSTGEKIIGSGPMDNLYKAYNDNGFVSTIIQCYNKHHNLIIRPDDVWIAIMVQFSRYIEANNGELRSKFVDFDGKKDLVVYCDTSLDATEYGDMAKMMAVKIFDNLKGKTWDQSSQFNLPVKGSERAVPALVGQGNTGIKASSITCLRRDSSAALGGQGKIANWIIPNFTTTTENDRIAASIITMASMQQYFSYEFALECGIPEVTMLGTIDDWIELREKAKLLLQYDNNLNIIKKWHSMLDPILEKFVQSISGNPDVAWWMSITNIYKPNGSESTYLSGWITTFCVFSATGQWLGDNRKHIIFGESFSFFDDSNDVTYHTIHSDYPFIDMDEIPAGYVFVPVKINDNGNYYESVMVAGHLGFSTLNDYLTLQPMVSWFIFLKK